MTAEPAAASTESMRQLGRDTVIYGLGVILSRAVSFVLLPVYTRYLRPPDYGLLQLLQMVLDLVAIAVSAGTTAGVLRFYFKADSETQRKGIVVTAFYLLMGLNLVGALFLVPAAPWIWRHALSEAGSPTLVRIAAFNFLLEPCITVPMLLMQALRKATLYASSSLVKLALGLSLNILFVVGMGEGVGGILVANLLSSLAVGGAMVIWMLRQTGLTPSRSAARDLRRFGVPYQLVTAGTFILTFGDRAFLQAFRGLAEVGIYGLAYQFGFVLVNLTSNPFFRAWAPHRLRLASSAPREVRDARFNEAFRYLNLLVISAAVAISLFAWPLLAIMSDPSFRPAARLIPVILLAYVVQVWTDAVALGIDVSEQTRYASFGTWAGVVAILVFYAALIPAFGGMGAAVATVAGFLVRFLFFGFFSHRLWPVAWHWGVPVRLLLIGAAVVAANGVAAPPGLAPRLASASGFLGLFLFIVWLVVLSGAERRRIVAFLRSPRRGIAAFPSS